VTSHPLLGRLLRKAGASADQAPTLEAWQSLLALVVAHVRRRRSGSLHAGALDRDLVPRDARAVIRISSGAPMTSSQQQRHRIVESLAMMHAMLESATEGDSRGRSRAADRGREPAAARAPARATDVTGLTHHRFVEMSCRWLVNPAQARERVEAIHTGWDTVDDEIATIDGRRLERHSAPVMLADGEFVGRVTFFRDRDGRAPQSRAGRACARDGRVGEPREDDVPGEHEPRATHAAQRGDRAGGSDAAGCSVHGAAARVHGWHRAERAASAGTGE